MQLTFHDVKKLTNVPHSFAVSAGVTIMIRIGDAGQGGYPSEPQADPLVVAQRQPVAVGVEQGALP